MKKTVAILFRMLVVLLACLLVLAACVEQKVDEHVHTFGEWVILKDSTCTESGVQFRKCTSCGQEENDYVSPKHKFEDAYCSVCGYKDPDFSYGLAYDGSEVTITFYHTMGENLRTVLDAYIEEFNKLYPNITINHKQVGGYDDVRKQISIEITVGKQPNIAYCYPDHVAEYNLSQAVFSLDDLIASTVEVTRADGTTEIMGLTAEQIDNFIDGFYNEGKQFGDGKMYTLPISKSTEVLYYNKTFFDENNLKVPTTWDEMEALCAKIKQIDPDSIPLGYDSEANWFITMCEQYGSPYTSATKVDGTNYLFNNETNWAFVERFASWYAKGWVTTHEILGNYTSNAFTKAEGELGKSYMSIGSSAGATLQTPDAANGENPFEVGIAPIPQVDNNNRKVISHGPSVCIFQKENLQEVYASWLFVKFLTTDESFQAALSLATGYIPAIESVAQNPAYAAFLASANGFKTGIAALSAKAYLEQKDAYFTPPAFVGSSAAREEVGLLMQTCFLNYQAAKDKPAIIKPAKKSQ